MGLGPKVKVLSGRKKKSRKNGGKRPQVLKLADEERRVDRFLNLAHIIMFRFGEGNLLWGGIEPCACNVVLYGKYLLI